MAEAVFGQVLTAMVTPFDAEGQINEAATVRLVNYLLENGSDGIVVCGTTGESPTLSHAEKLRLFRLVKQTVGSRGAVIAGTGGNDTAASIVLTQEAAEIGVDGALLVVPPYNKPSQEGLYRHFRAIAEAAPGLPCMLYNVPGRTAQNMEAATVIRLAHDVSNIVSVKEASGNLVQVAEIIAGAPSAFAVYSGDDALTLPILAVGGVGVVSVTGHAVGKDFKQMHSAFFAGRLAEAAALNGKMLPIVRAFFQPTTPSPAPVKAAMNLLGLEVGGLRLPLVEANERERGIVRAALADYGLL
ncbi:MAG TPA: 4-hydroxy-tetrahydrodipicolinate synthase [Chthonomonadaceae bacterium]|nr:4-hydroxy-tetrahydrodipicolinate synthase [Chthonomonadaceae bacterium]